MASQAITKRPIILSLAELEKYPTLEDRYAITLPLKLEFHLLPNCDHDYDDYYDHWCESCWTAEPPRWYLEMRAECIRRTGERWAWFSAARDLDDKCGERLGTLGYLPWEVRQEILKHVIRDSYDQFPRQFITKDLVAAGRFPVMFQGRHTPFYGMLFASPSTKAEFEYHYLTHTEFAFASPQILEAFLDRLSAYQRSLLRSVTFVIRRYWSPSPKDFSRDWFAAFALLPSNLVSIHFDASFFRTLINGDGQGFICHGRWESRWENVDLIAEVTDMLAIYARRCAARAKIGLSNRGLPAEYVDEAEEGAVPVLRYLEPWSKNWREWWEETKDDDLIEGEGATDVA